MLAYDERTLAQTAAFSTALDLAPSYISGVWMSGFALAADSSSSVYFSVGNGPFDANTGGANYGQSVLRLSSALAAQDYFAPHNALTPDQQMGGT